MTILRSRVTNVHLAVLLDCAEPTVRSARRRKALPKRPRVRTARPSQVWVRMEAECR